MATTAGSREEELMHEIVELHRQNREINERLNNRGRRLGRGGFLRPIGGRGGRGKRKAENELEGNARKISSAIVKVGGDAGEARRKDFAQEPKSESPREFLKVDDPKLAKRNRRMFGSLLGTLEKFRQEEISHTEAAMRRTDTMKKAVQKAQEESEKLRQQEREHYTERRKRDLMLRAKITAKAEGKQIDLLFMQWAAHHNKLSSFLKTKCEPGIYYLPGKQTERDKKQLEEQQKEFEEWKVKCRQEQDGYQQQVAETYIAKAQADIEKVGLGRNRKRTQLESEAKGAEEGEENEMEQEAEREDAGEDGGEQVAQEENDALVADVMEEDDDYRPEDDGSVPVPPADM